MDFFDRALLRYSKKALYAWGAGIFAAVWIVASSAKAGTCNGPAAEWAPLTYPGLDTFHFSDLTGVVMVGTALILATLYLRARYGLTYPG